MKNIIQSLLGLIGIRIVRANNARKYLPKPDIDVIQIISQLFYDFQKPLTVLQIGACDGFTSDSIFPYIKAGSIDAYLVEPIKLNFDKLSAFYSETSNAVLINAAVAEKDEIRTMYSVKDDGKWKDEGWARQLASFYRQHLYNHGFKDHEIVEQEVSCKTLNTLIEENRISELDVLLIDTEGFDGEVVKMAMAQDVRPNFLVFENAQLVQNYSQKELDGLYDLLNSNGYSWVHDRINTMAVKKDFLKV